MQKEIHKTRHENHARRLMAILMLHEASQLLMSLTAFVLHVHR